MIYLCYLTIYKKIINPLLIFFFISSQPDIKNKYIYLILISPGPTYWIIILLSLNMRLKLVKVYTFVPDVLLAAAGGTAGEYALAGMDPVGGRPLLGSVADEPDGN